MKILVLLNSYQDDGPGTLMFSLIQNLFDRGDIKFYTAALSRSGKLKSVYEEMLVPTKVFKMRGYIDLPFMISFYKYLKKEKFDIIHTNLIRADIIGRLFGKFLKTPIIITTEHGIHTWKFKGKIFEPIIESLYLYSAKFTEKIIPVSQFVKNNLMSKDLPLEKIQMVYNGVDAEVFAPISKKEKLNLHTYISDEPFVNFIGTVGNLVPLKGTKYFIDAIPKILEKHPSSMFVIIGDGPLKEELEEYIESKGLSGRVKMLGQLKAILPKLTAALDVVVQPSLTESFGLSVAEAQACSVPVVATRVGGIPEIVVNESTGYLVDPENSEQIAEKVIMLLDNPEKADEMGIAGRRRILENFTIEKTATQYYKIYSTLYDAYQEQKALFAKQKQIADESSEENNNEPADTESTATEKIPPEIMPDEATGNSSAVMQKPASQSSLNKAAADSNAQNSAEAGTSQNNSEENKN